MSFLNGLSALGQGVADTAQKFGAEQIRGDLDLQRSVLAGQLAATAADKQRTFVSGQADKQQAFQAGQAGKQQAFTAGESVLNRQATKDRADEANIKSLDVAGLNRASVEGEGALNRQAAKDRADEAHISALSVADLRGGRVFSSAPSVQNGESGNLITYRDGTTEFVKTNATPIGRVSSMPVISPETGRRIAAQIADTGDMSAATGLARSGASMAMVNDELTKILSERGSNSLSMKENKMKFQTFQKMSDAFASGPDGKTLTAADTAVAHLDTLQKAGVLLNNGQVPILNGLKNWIEGKIGHTAPNNFDAIRDIAGNEIVKAVLGSAGALKDREELRTRINSSQNEEQLAGVINEYKELFAGRIRAIKQRWEANVPPGVNYGSFEDRLLPETRKALGLLEATKGAAGPTSPAIRPVGAGPAPAATSPAAPATVRQPKASDLPEGTVVDQGGVMFRYTNGQYVRIN